MEESGDHESNCSIRVVPTKDDILLSRGRKYTCHPSNYYFRGTGVAHVCLVAPTESTRSPSRYLSFFEELVIKHRDGYHATTELSKKKEILKGIVAAIPNEGRFLRRDGDHWVVLSPEQALIKTAQALYYRSRVERNLETAAPQEMIRLHSNVPYTVLASERVGVDPPHVRAQKTLELYSQWMVRANEVFWEQVAGPEARALFPEDMLAAVPFSSKYETSFPNSS
jgi:hypothetical protein